MIKNGNRDEKKVNQILAFFTVMGKRVKWLNANWKMCSSKKFARNPR
jgi:hypothetical protein